MSRFVDVKAVKAAVTMLLVLEHYGRIVQALGEQPQRALPASWGREPDAVSRLTGKELLELFRHLQGWRNILGFVARKEGCSLTRNDAVKTMIAQVIRTCRERGRKIGICGQAPSDYPDFA